MQLINHSLKKGAAIAAAGALMFSLFVSGGPVLAAPPSAPVITTTSQTTNVSPFTITGTAEPNATVRVAGGVGTQEASTTASGNWSVSVPLQFNEPNILSVVAINAAGEISSASTVTITHDNIGPAEPVIISPVSPHATTSQTIIVSGTVASNSNGVLSITGGAGGSVQAFANGSNWSAEVQLTPNTTNTLTVTTWDGVGNPAGTTLIVTHTTATSTPDVTAPLTPSIVSPASPHSTTTSPITVTGMAEGGSTVTVTGGSANATTTANGIGHFSVMVPLNLGANTLLFRSTDAAGNVSNAATLLVTLATSTGTTTDTTAPNAPIVTFPVSPHMTTANAVVMTGTAESGSTIRVTGGTTTPVTATTSMAGNWSVLVQLPTGTTTTFLVTATDAAGNTSSSTAVVITQTTTGGTGTTTSTSSPVITLNGDASVTAFSCNDFVDLGASAVSSTGTPLTVTSTSTVNIDEPGTYTVVYTAVDADGNVATATRTVIVLACSSGGGGGGGGGSAGDSNTGGTTPPPFIGVTPPVSGVLPVVVTTGIPTTQVLGASFVPGLPTTGGGEEAFKVFLPILLSFGLVLLGLSLKRKESQLS